MSKHREKLGQILKRILGGDRPSGPRQGSQEMPLGIEVLVRKAAVDLAFRELLMQKRAGAAREIDLTLTQAEMAMLDAVPEGQLAAFVENTTVPDPQRRVFLGRDVAAMMAAIEEGYTGPPEQEAAAGPRYNADMTRGIRPDLPIEPKFPVGPRAPDAASDTASPANPTTAAPGEKDIQPDQQ